VDLEMVPEKRCEFPGWIE